MRDYDSIYYTPLIDPQAKKRNVSSQRPASGSLRGISTTLFPQQTPDFDPWSVSSSDPYQLGFLRASRYDRVDRRQPPLHLMVVEEGEGREELHHFRVEEAEAVEVGQLERLSRAWAEAEVEEVVIRGRMM